MSYSLRYGPFLSITVHGSWWLSKLSSERSPLYLVLLDLLHVGVCDVDMFMCMHLCMGMCVHMYVCVYMPEVNSYLFSQWLPHLLRQDLSSSLDLTDNQAGCPVNFRDPLVSASPTLRQVYALPCSACYIGSEENQRQVFMPTWHHSYCSLSTLVIFEESTQQFPQLDGLWLCLQGSFLIEI